MPWADESGVAIFDDEDAYWLTVEPGTEEDDYDDYDDEQEDCDCGMCVRGCYCHDCP